MDKGDRVSVRGRVLRVEGGLLRVKTDSGQVMWVCPQDARPALPPEPPDGTWLRGQADWSGRTSVFHRDDAEGHPERRGDDPSWAARWWDYTAQEWVPWEVAWQRGADPGLRLLPFPAEQS